MKKYLMPEFEVIEYKDQDVLTASGDDVQKGMNELPEFNYNS